MPRLSGKKTGGKRRLAPVAMIFRNNLQLRGDNEVEPPERPG